MHVYPESTHGKKVSEVWQSKKWLQDVPDHVLTPMFRCPRDDKVFYVNEMVSYEDGKLFIPERFFVHKSVMHAVGRNVNLHSVIIYASCLNYS